MTQDDPFGTSRSKPGMGTTLAPLAAQVMAELYERQSGGQTGTRPVVVDYLLRAVTSRDAFNAGLVFEELRGHRLTVDAIIDLYIPSVAARMGEQWILSEIDFASVTVGALRLQSLLGEASSELASMDRRAGELPVALVVVPEGEQHFLGASVVAAQLRRLGCEVSLSIAEPQKQILNRVLYDHPHMVLLSCSRVAGLESIEQTVKKIKTAVSPAPVLALGGAVTGETETLRTRTGVDLVTKAAKDVVGFYTRRLKALKSE
ncbi:MAG: cobalamin B12-binding domain-containing protein [Pseudomonadota bacterium]